MQIAIDCGLSQLSTVPEYILPARRWRRRLSPLHGEERTRGSRQILGHEGKQLHRPGFKKVDLRASEAGS